MNQAIGTSGREEAARRSARSAPERGRATPAALLVVFVALALAGVADASRHEGRSLESFVARHAERLGLDDGAQARIEAIAEASGVRDRALRERLDAAREALHALLRGGGDAEPPSEAEVMQAADRIAEAEAARDRNRLRAILEIHRVLTPEQRRELTAIREEHRTRKHRHRRGMKACREEVARLCAGAEDNRSRLACLVEQWTNLDETCHQAFDRLAPRAGDADAPAVERRAADSGADVARSD